MRRHSFETRRERQFTESRGQALPGGISHLIGESVQE